MSNSSLININLSQLRQTLQIYNKIKNDVIVINKNSDYINKNTDKQNKDLNYQNKLLSKNIQQMKLINTLSSKFSAGKFSGFVNSMKSSISGLGNLGGSLVNSVGGKFSGLVNSIKSSISGLGNLGGSGKIGSSILGNIGSTLSGFGNMGVSLIKGISGKLKMGLLGLGGLAASGAKSLFSSALSEYNGTLNAKNKGINLGESNALNFAGKMTGLGENTLVSSIEKLKTSLSDSSKLNSFSSLGLNADNLKNQNPTEALFEVLNAVKNMKTNGYDNNYIKNVMDDIGIPFDNFKFVLEEGTGEI